MVPELLRERINLSFRLPFFLLLVPHFSLWPSLRHLEGHPTLLLSLHISSPLWTLVEVSMTSSQFCLITRSNWKHERNHMLCSWCRIFNIFLIVFLFFLYSYVKSYSHPQCSWWFLFSCVIGSPVSTWCFQSDVLDVVSVTSEIQFFVDAGLLPGVPLFLLPWQSQLTTELLACCCFL